MHIIREKVIDGVKYIFEHVCKKCENGCKMKFEGEFKAFLTSIKNLTESQNITIDKAMDYLKIPASHRQFYLEEFKKIKSETN